MRRLVCLEEEVVGENGEVVTVCYDYFEEVEEPEGGQEEE